MDGFFDEEKSSFKMLGLSLLDYICVLALSLLLKLSPRKLEHWLVLQSFSPKFALYLCKSTVRPCMEYCYNVWAGAPNCYLVMLDKLCKHILSISYLYRYYFVRCSSEFMGGHSLFWSSVLDVQRMSISAAIFLTHPDSKILCL